MKIGLIVHKINQFEPNTGQNAQDQCAKQLISHCQSTLVYVTLPDVAACTTSW